MHYQEAMFQIYGLYDNRNPSMTWNLWQVHCWSNLIQWQRLSPAKWIKYGSSTMLHSIVQILRCIQNLTDIYERALNENWFSLYSNLRYYQTKNALNIFLMLEYFSENLLSLTWIFCIKIVTQNQLISISHQLSIQ